MLNAQTHSTGTLQRTTSTPEQSGDIVTNGSGRLKVLRRHDRGEVGIDRTGNYHVHLDFVREGQQDPQRLRSAEQRKTSDTQVSPQRINKHILSPLGGAIGGLSFQSQRRSLFLKFFLDEVPQV